MKLSDLYSEKEEEKFLFEMANFDGRRTGIERVIMWASQAQDGARKHGPRIKVSANYTNNAKASDLFVLTIEDDPKQVAGESHLETTDLQKVKDWIVLNKEVLLDFWNGNLLTDDFLEKLKKL